MAAFLYIASGPGAGRGLIEGRYGPECHVHLILVKCRYFSEVVHIVIVVLWRQVVQLAVRVSTAGQLAHWPPVFFRNTVPIRWFDCFCVGVRGCNEVVVLSLVAKSSRAKSPEGRLLSPAW